MKRQSPEPQPKEATRWLVDVAVPAPLRQTFTYALPPGIEPSAVRQGHRILVPFRAKLLHGVTMTPAYAGEDPENRFRAFVSYEERSRIMAPEIHDLVDWVARYYKSPVGEVVKMVLPPGTLSEQEIMFRLSPSGAARVKAFDDEDTRLLGHLSGKALTRKQWQARAQTEIPFGAIRQWEDLGYLEMTARGRERESVPHVTSIQLTNKGRATTPGSLERAPAQRALLAWLLKRAERHVTPAAINDTFPNGSATLGRLVKAGLCRRVRIPKHELERGHEDFESDPIKHLTAEQDTSLRALVSSLERRQFQSFLMFGVTGSGKTEVYLRAVQACLSQGRRALLLVPEIALTPLMHRRIESRFGERLAILHSAVGAARRAEAWARVLAGKVDVVLGARSGIFAPLPDLGLVIVDEEHDQSYKQNDGVRYHARDLALVRAKMAGATAVLGSATPSLESWHNHRIGRHGLLTLKKRATKAKLPAVSIVDMREEFRIQQGRPLLSRLLAQQMERVLHQGHQVMVLLNRRGYHSFLLCRKCGETVMCSQCEVSLTYHQTERALKCHYCGERRPLPQACPACDSPRAMMQFFGEGTQQVQERLQRRFPDVVVDRLDRDRLAGREAHYQILNRFGKGETHVLVGTQMIAKGHDFPNVTLVGILNADAGLRIPDFRGAEVTFQLITQVSGRSGRGKDPGIVVIQTYMPEHYSIACAAQHDFPSFLTRELRYRQKLFYAPFAHMAAILVTHRDEARVQQATVWMAAQLEPFQKKGDLVVLGPAKAPIGKIKHAHRYQIVLKSGNRRRLHQLADHVVEAAVRHKLMPRQAIILDIDPYQFF